VTIEKPVDPRGLPPDERKKGASDRTVLLEEAQPGAPVQTTLRAEPSGGIGRFQPVRSSRRATYCPAAPRSASAPTTYTCPTRKRFTCNGLRPSKGYLVGSGSARAQMRQDRAETRHLRRDLRVEALQDVVPELVLDRLGHVEAAGIRLEDRKLELTRGG